MQGSDGCSVVGTTVLGSTRGVIVGHHCSMCRHVMGQTAATQRGLPMRLFDAVLRFAGVVTLALVVVSIVSFCALPAFDRENFFDENALLVHSATPTFQ